MIHQTPLIKMAFGTEKSCLKVERQERSKSKMKRLKEFDWNKRRKNYLKSDEEKKHRSRSRI